MVSFRGQKKLGLEKDKDKVHSNVVIEYSVGFLWEYTTRSFVSFAFHKHANSKVQKPPSQLRFSLPSIIITITSNEPWNKETHKTDRNPPITDHKS